MPDRGKGFFFWSLRNKHRSFPCDYERTYLSRFGELTLGSTRKFIPLPWCWSGGREGEGKMPNEFAEWHVAWLAEWHNYADCNISEWLKEINETENYALFCANQFTSSRFFNVAESTTMTIKIKERLLDFSRSISFLQSHKDSTCLY